jgi:hypothetical protein
MTLTLSLIRTGIILGIGLIALSYALSGFWTISIGLIVLGAIWFFLHNRFAWISTLSLILIGGAGAASFLSGSQSVWGMLGVLSSLSVWDLDRFYWRLKRQEVRHERVLVQRHLRFLGVLDGIALLILGLSFRVRFQLSFAVVFFLTLIAIYCLTKGVSSLFGE